MGTGTDYVNTTTGPGDAELGPHRGTESSDPAVIARDIEQTRDEMTGTVDAIQERLEPERLSAEAKEVAHYAIAEAKGAVQELAGQASSAIHEATIGRVERLSINTRDGAQSMKNDLFSTIKANPIPAALAAVGIGWLWLHRASDTGYQGGMIGSRGSQATGYGSHYYDAYGVSGMEPQSPANQAQQMAGQVASQVQERAGQMQHQLMGETRDRVIGSVQEVAGQTMDKAQHIAQEAGRAAMEEAKSQGVTSGSQSATGAPA
jgi:uncharacterized protein YjbJ (UPF0337 family)